MGKVFVRNPDKLSDTNSIHSTVFTLMLRVIREFLTLVPYDPYFRCNGLKLTLQFIHHMTHLKSVDVNNIRCVCRYI